MGLGKWIYCRPESVKGENMIRVSQIKVPVGSPLELVEKRVLKELKCKDSDITAMYVSKKSIDARKVDAVKEVYTIDVELNKEHKIFKKSGSKLAKIYHRVYYNFQVTGEDQLTKRPVIIGDGPCGLMAAWELAHAGFHPIVIEQGKTVEERRMDVGKMWATGELNLNSNVSFGEGGAGTFSDGKLNTLVKDPVGRNLEVLHVFASCGAPEEILYLSNPHIGTDKLYGVLQCMRAELEKLGTTFKFNTKVTDFIIKDDKLVALELNHNQQLECDLAILAIGHSSRDTFEQLQQREVELAAKNFAVGLRVEHPQELISQHQYHDAYKKLPPANYKLTAKATSGRGVYSFCMCPGGQVINASTEEGRLVVNGMSNYKRDGVNANSAIIVSVTTDDYPDKGPLSGMHFQRQLEEKAYKLGKGAIPQQLYGDFVNRKVSTSYGEFESTTQGEHQFADLSILFSEEIYQSIIEGMEQFGKKITNFNRKDCIMSGIESRTSSPVRIIRDDSFQSNVKGLYPAGEGAGYAGGIMSAAMDGIKVAEAIAKSYKGVK